MACRCGPRVTIHNPAVKKGGSIVTTPEARTCRKCGGKLVVRKLVGEGARTFYEVPPCNCGG